MPINPTEFTKTLPASYLSLLDQCSKTNGETKNNLCLPVQNNLGAWDDKTPEVMCFEPFDLCSPNKAAKLEIKAKAGGIIKYGLISLAFAWGLFIVIALAIPIDASNFIIDIVLIGSFVMAITAIGWAWYAGYKINISDQLADSCANTEKLLSVTDFSEFKRGTPLYAEYAPTNICRPATASTPVIGKKDAMRETYMKWLSRT